MLLPFLALWVFIGIVVGFVFSKVVNLHGDDPMGGMATAAVGAVLGGLGCNLYKGSGFTNWNTTSCIYAAVFAAGTCVLWHVIRSRFVSRTPQTRRQSY